ncbi:hypothetical protein BJ322DRAFT_1022600 [Thelephora terrestris]|uniref:Uncharacterized protein n=1 Tax=Thelephora terrestris TaxID=56493 RepID=A0A9P6H8W9_9AGAM|nr:hypothetical protein BJ322DRAFT_1022600 [Thelephora terrestris]
MSISHGGPQDVYATSPLSPVDVMEFMNITLLVVNFWNMTVEVAEQKESPSVITNLYKDLKNPSWGWCAITSLDNYSPKNGRELVLWDLNLMVEFPLGSIIFIPSAILCHSNMSVSGSETQSSLIQYNLEGLFWWAAYDFSLERGRKKVESSGRTPCIQCSPSWCAPSSPNSPYTTSVLELAMTASHVIVGTFVVVYSMTGKL